VGLLFRYATVGDGISKAWGGVEPLFRYLDGIPSLYAAHFKDGRLSLEVQRGEETRVRYRFAYEENPSPLRDPKTKDLAYQPGRRDSLLFDFVRAWDGNWVLLPAGDKYVQHELLAVAFDIFDFVLVHCHQSLYLHDDGLGDDNKWIVIGKQLGYLIHDGEAEVPEAWILKVVSHAVFRRYRTHKFRTLSLPKADHEPGDACIARPLANRGTS